MKKEDKNKFIDVSIIILMILTFLGIIYIIASMVDYNLKPYPNPQPAPPAIEESE